MQRGRLITSVLDSDFINYRAERTCGSVEKWQRRIINAQATINNHRGVRSSDSRALFISSVIDISGTTYRSSWCNQRRAELSIYRAISCRRHSIKCSNARRNARYTTDVIVVVDVVVAIFAETCVARHDNARRFSNAVTQRNVMSLLIRVNSMMTQRHPFSCSAGAGTSCDSLLSPPHFQIISKLLPNVEKNIHFFILLRNDRFPPVFSARQHDNKTYDKMIMTY